MEEEEGFGKRENAFETSAATVLSCSVQFCSGPCFKNEKPHAQSIKVHITSIYHPCHRLISSHHPTKSNHNITHPLSPQPIPIPNTIHPIHIQRKPSTLTLHNPIPRLIETAQRIQIDHRVEIGLEIPCADHDRAVGEHVRVVCGLEAVEGEFGVAAVLHCPEGVAFGGVGGVGEVGFGAVAAVGAVAGVVV